VLNLPELNLENPAVRQHIWAGRDSVVRSYLRDGADGWRLDTAYELGPTYLRELTAAAHREKPGSLVVGEIANHPGGWTAGDGRGDELPLAHMLLGLANGEIGVAQAGAVIDRTLADVGTEPMLKSWVLLDNHDVPRVATELPDMAQRRLAQVLQFTLPGAPNLYYGCRGRHDRRRRPRAARPDALGPGAATTTPRWSGCALITLRQQHRALRVGDYRSAIAGQPAGLRAPHRPRADSVLVLANPGDQPVTERCSGATG
jgi:glycosidase